MWKDTLKRIFSNITGRYYSYETIPLKIYFAISNSGIYTLIYKGWGSPVLQDCSTAWESIVKVNAKENNNLEYGSYFDTVQAYGNILADYNIVKACLLKLAMKYSAEDHKILKDKGYHIDPTSNEAYAETIFAAMRKSDNLVTKLMSKQNELGMMSSGMEGQVVTFDKAVAEISYQLNFEVDDTITLARYNVYKKLIKEKHGRRRTESDTEE